MPAKPVFISYAHEDETTVVRLKEALKANGISIWIDHENLEPGTPDWQRAIELGVPECQALIYVATPHAKDSKQIRNELYLAIQRKVRIYPYWVAGAEWVDVAPLDLVLAQYIDARAEQGDYGTAFSKLLKMLKEKDTLNKPAQPSDSSHYGTQPAIAVVPVINPLAAQTTPTTPAPMEPSTPTQPPVQSAAQDTPRNSKGNGSRWFRPIAAMLVALLLLSGISAVVLANHLGQHVTDRATPTIVPTQQPPHWTVVANPNPGSHINVLYSVDAIAADNVWAAGYYRNSPSTASKFTLIERWDGSSWQQITSPNGGADINVLNGIEALGPNDVWAVGDAGTDSLIEHWNGSSWVKTSSPNVGADQNYLNAVTARAASDVWAVGSSRDTPNDAARTLIEHWDGSSWHVTPSPNLGSDNNILYGVATLKQGNDVWAVGFHRDSPHSFAHPLVEHWDGSSWQAVLAPSVGSGDNVLNGIAAVAPNDIWAVGYSEQTSKDPARSLIEHWDGSSWTIITSPNVGSGYNNLYSVTALKSNDVWAVGVGPLIVHWDGSSWQPVTSQGIDPTRNILNSISAVDADDIWAVGVFGGADQTSSNYTLIEHWTSS